MHLVNGSRVVIVGGGPAGSLSALHLLKYASQAGLSLDITILEGRDFDRPGPNSCNKCAGILSSTLVHNLKSLDLNLPPEIIQSEITTYILHLNKIDLPIQQPDPNRQIVSIYRGSGPRLGGPPFPASFDGWLLRQAQQRGARLQQVRAQSIQSGYRLQVITDRDTIDADLVILATGVNSRAPLDSTWGYRPPHTEVMAQDEVPLPDGLHDSNVHIYFDYPPGLIFGCLIPKGRYANISLLGRGLKPGALGDFMDGHNLTEYFPEGMPMLCGCVPRVAVSTAKGYFADRLVVVGDAAVSRLYKDGIGAAFITAQAASRTAIQRGIARKDFLAEYGPVCRRIAIDNFYGKILFRMWNLVRNSPRFLNIWQNAILAEVDIPPTNHIHTRILWSIFTGDESYQKIFWLTVSAPAMHRLWKEASRS